MHTRTLLLTPWFMPIRVIPWEAAVKLKYEGLADVVVEYEDEIRSPSTTWKVPAVMRLRKLAKRERVGLKYSRLAVYQRDGFECMYCPPGTKLAFHELTRDHVVPRAHGGRTTWTNTVSCCKFHNSLKGSKSCDEAGMWPRKAPTVPRELGFVPPILGKEIPPEWQGFTGGF